MNKIIISTNENSDIIPIVNLLSKESKKSIAIQDYKKAYNLLHNYDFPLYDQLISDGPGYELEDSFKENIYANYDVVVVHILTLNILAESIMNNFNSIIFDGDIPSVNRHRGTINYARNNFKEFIFLKDTDNKREKIEKLWRKND
jgi:hypothetical protein